MTKPEYIEKLCECTLQDESCPYFDWRYQKCNMLATENYHPRDECDMYYDEDFE